MQINNITPNKNCKANNIDIINNTVNDNNEQIKINYNNDNIITVTTSCSDDIINNKKTSKYIPSQEQNEEIKAKENDEQIDLMNNNTVNN